MSGLLILKSDRICVSMPAVVRALLPNRPTVRQKKKGKFGPGGGGGGGGGRGGGGGEASNL